MDNMMAIIEIGSNNTKTHIYNGEELVYENTVTIEFKKNYKNENRINENDLSKLDEVIENALKYTKNINIYGCSIFRSISNEELSEINKKLNNKKVIDKKFYGFGVVDVTNKFDTLKNDIPSCTFSEVYNYVNDLIGDIDVKADVLILAGGDHFYWYNNARYDLIENSLYKNENQKYMLTIEMCDKYDQDALVTSLDRVRANSDNPKWFDGSRAMKVITNLIAHKVDAKYIMPTKINMEDGLKMKNVKIIF